MKITYFMKVFFPWLVTAAHILLCWPHEWSWRSRHRLTITMCSLWAAKPCRFLHRYFIICRRWLLYLGKINKTSQESLSCTYLMQKCALYYNDSLWRRDGVHGKHCTLHQKSVFYQRIRNLLVYTGSTGLSRHYVNRSRIWVMLLLDGLWVAVILTVHKPPALPLPSYPHAHTPYACLPRYLIYNLYTRAVSKLSHMQSKTSTKQTKG